MNSEDRFEKILEEGKQMKSEGTRIILRDKETGVCYLVWHSGYAGGITPLLGADGKVIVKK